MNGQSVAWLGFVMPISLMVIFACVVKCAPRDGNGYLVAYHSKQKHLDKRWRIMKQNQNVNSNYFNTDNSITLGGYQRKFEEGEEKHKIRKEKSDTKIKHRPVVICGPSGVGKGTLINRLVKHYKTSKYGSNNCEDIFGFCVSHTSRRPRPGESDGVHYHFSTREEIEANIRHNKFIEYNDVHGNLYGTSYEAVQSEISSGRITIMDIDVSGVKRVKQSNLEPFFIFVCPPSIEDLETRLRLRNTESEEAILRRIRNAQEELEYGLKPGNFDEVIVNDDIDTAFKKLTHALEERFAHLKER
mmetsp:Transcript_8878/g.12653  ORF Transcript_8878/g.12653 Transcript_8878/m.12653 type:complete len:301 (+) Transcript_8878:150-1052(+)